MRTLTVLVAIALGACGGSAEDSEPLVETEGCDSTTLYARSEVPEARGPWPVGVRTVELGRLDVEVLYPAVVGSEEGLDPMQVDIRYAIPEQEQSKVTDEKRPHQSCDCYTGLPVDEAHGPYPLVLFVHGTAGWRNQSLSLMEHWASRGFVVASADHPGLWLSDLLGSICGIPASGSQDLQGDLETVLNSFRDDAEVLGFLSDRVDLNRVAVIGHSAGGSAATGSAELPGVEVVISLAGSGSTAVSSLSSALFVGGIVDTVMPFSRTQSAFENSSVPRRLVGIADAGHLVFSDICELTNDDGQDLVEIATEAGVCGTQFASFLFDCEATSIPAENSSALLKAATTWELERHLHCEEALEEFELLGGQSSWAEVLESSDLE